MMKCTEYSVDAINNNSSVDVAEDVLGFTPDKAQPENVFLVQGSDKITSLTALWEHVTRTKTLPENFDTDQLFEVIHQRLRNPEWEIRQNALRVLSDFVDIIPVEFLSDKVDFVLDDLVTNLGHVRSSVRKGAADCLRVYLNRLKSRSNDILKNLVQFGVERSNAQIPQNITLGIIKSIPYLIIPNLTRATLKYIVHTLLTKLSNSYNEETVLKSLLKIREIIGYDLFEDLLKAHDTFNTKEQFNSLCDKYNLYFYMRTKSLKYQASAAYKTEDVDSTEDETKLDEHNVILETDIKLQSGDMITMKIHEENNNNEGSVQQQDGNPTFKILPEEEDYDHLRRTPRRVRFGGEDVKLRTPDSNYDEHEEDETISIVSAHGEKQPIIEVKYIDKETKTVTRTSRSLIPIPVKSRVTQSEPSTPIRNKVNPRLKSYKSSPNLSKSTKISNVSRIPRRFNTEVKKSVETKIQINIKDQLKVDNANLKPKKVQQRRTSRDNSYSPVPVHNEIELLHNLTRSPLPEIKPRKLHSAQIPTSEGNSSPWTQRANISQQSRISNRPFSNMSAHEKYSSFRVYDSFQRSDVEDYFATSSSSGSETERRQDLGLDRRTMDDLYNQDNIFARQRALEELNRTIQNEDVLNSLQDRLPALVHVLCSALHNTLLQQVAAESLKTIFTKMQEQHLLVNVHHIFHNLCKLGSPQGLKFAILFMERIPPKIVVDQLLADSVLKAKSSKVREGALQIIMTVARMYPSTNLNIPKTTKAVAVLLKDKKRRVRYAALETLAALSQINSAGVLALTHSMFFDNSEDGEQVLKVIRSRLSRKQLPTVYPNGNIRYSTPTGESELEWLRRGISTPKTPERNEEKNEQNTQFLGESMERSFEGSTTSCSVNGEVQAAPSKKDSSEVNDGRESQLGRRESFWRRNSRRDLGRSEENYISNEEEPENRTSTTQLYAIDPTSFTLPVDVSSSSNANTNSGLQAIYLKPSPTECRTVSTNTPPHNYKEDATNTSPTLTKKFHLPKTIRGRSYSPPQAHRLSQAPSDYDSFEDLYDSEDRGGCHQRVVKTGYRKEVWRIRAQERFRKSFSSEQLRKESTYSSGSSSSSSIRQTGNWGRDPRSAIPVPVYGDNGKLRFRSRGNVYRTKGPMTIPYYQEVKSPSPVTTPEPEKLPPDEPEIARQPFSSGSESSGYFTPPPENVELSPERTPSRRFSLNVTEVDASPTKKSERFIQIDSPRNSVEVQDVDDDEEEELPSSRDFNDEDDNSNEVPNDNSVEIESYHGEDEEELQKDDNQNIKVTHTADDPDCTKISISENNTELDITILTHISRKNVNSAPETTTIKTENNIKTNIPTINSSLVRRKTCKVSNANVELFPDDLQPFGKPKEAMADTLNQLVSSEWEVVMKGLQNLVRLIRHHKDYVENNIHGICAVLGNQISNLRSQVARASCKVSGELFGVGRKHIENELDKLATPLLQRTADTNKFLQADANAALDEMCAKLSIPKVVAVIVSVGCNHQNATVRCASARLLANIVKKLGAEKVFQLPRDTRDKILFSGCNLLTEGKLETRQHAKLLLRYLVGHCQFQKALTESVPASILRHIDKSLKTL